MRILIDINHPAHVHYFRNFISIMKEKGHKILVVSRNKEIEFNLLNHYSIPFTSRGKGSEGFFGKFLYMLKADLFLLIKSLSFKPDLFLSFLHPYPAHVSFLIRKPHVAFSDTDHAKLHHKLTIPFSKVILTPECYTKDLGKKHIRFKGYMELCYLHPKRFNPDKSVLDQINIKNNERYVVLRFVSWKAIHDAGFKGLNSDFKFELVNVLSKYAKVLISSEGKLPPELEKYRITLPPHQMHNLLANASLFVGEGATMASECAMLGTPAIYINPLELSYCEEEEKKYNLIFNFRNPDGVLKKVEELLSMENLREEFQLKRQKMLGEQIDVTALMVWFIENWPNSFNIMNVNRNIQEKFI